MRGYTVRPVHERDQASLAASCERIVAHLARFPKVSVAVFITTSRLRAVDSREKDRIAVLTDRWTLVGTYDHRATPRQILDDVEACG